MSFPKSKLASWVKSYKAGKLEEIGQSYRVLSDTELELTKLRRELAEVKMERDI